MGFCDGIGEEIEDLLVVDLEEWGFYDELGFLLSLFDLVKYLMDNPRYDAPILFAIHGAERSPHGKSLATYNFT